MKATFLAVTLLCTTHLFSQEAPKPTDFAKWAGFPDNFNLHSEEIKRGDFAKWGTPKWIYSYQNREKSLIGYVVAVYQPGTLWPDNKDQFIKAIREQVQKGESLGADFRENVHIDKDRNGREIYFTVLGFGPGGTLLGGVTFQPEYDLVVTQIFDHQDDTPDDQRLKDPISPSKKLPEVFSKVQDYLSNTNIQSEQGAAANP